MINLVSHLSNPFKRLAQVVVSAAAAVGISGCGQLAQNIQPGGWIDAFAQAQYDAVQGSIDTVPHHVTALTPSNYEKQPEGEGPFIFRMELQAEFPTSGPFYNNGKGDLSTPVYVEYLVAAEVSPNHNPPLLAPGQSTASYEQELVKIIEQNQPVTKGAFQFYGAQFLQRALQRVQGYSRQPGESLRQYGMRVKQILASPR